MIQVIHVLNSNHDLIHTHPWLESWNLIFFPEFFLVNVEKAWLKSRYVTRIKLSPNLNHEVIWLESHVSLARIMNKVFSFSLITRNITRIGLWLDSNHLTRVITWIKYVKYDFYHLDSSQFLTWLESSFFHWLESKCYFYSILVLWL